MQQDYISLTEAAKLSPGRPSTNAIWRWCRKGVLSRTGQRVRLDHVRIGGKIFTTETDLQKFFRQVAESDRAYFQDPDRSPDLSAKRPTDKQRQRRIDRAERELRNSGF